MPVFGEAVKQDNRRAGTTHHHVKLEAISRNPPLNKFYFHQYWWLLRGMVATCVKKLKALYCATIVVQPHAPPSFAARFILVNRRI
jgi:hypothetical protein